MEDNYDISKLKKKKRKNGKNKGNTFENKIADIFNKRLGTKEFARTPGSGAFATTHSLPKHLKVYGDLITPEYFRFCIECKKGYNEQNLYSLYNESSTLWKFLEQSQKDSDKCGRINLLIFKQDYRDTLAIIPDSLPTTQITKSLVLELDGKPKYRVCFLEELLKEPDEFFFTKPGDLG